MKPTRRGGIYANTEYRREKLFESGGMKLSLVEAHPKTGRTHQLRAHFAAIGTPIVGDAIYGDEALNATFRAKLGIQRQMLHAAAIGFVHPTENKFVTFRAPLPEDFRHVLERLGG